MLLKTLSRWVHFICLNWIGEADTYFNSRYSWNDNCIMNEGTDADALTVAFHEFGHWMVFKTLRRRRLEDKLIQRTSTGTFT